MRWCSSPRSSDRSGSRWTPQTRSRSPAPRPSAPWRWWYCLREATRVDRLGLSGELTGHPREDHAVERHHRVPVQPSPQSTWLEAGPLAQTAPVAVRRDAELEPGLTRHLHLGVQEKQARPLQGLDPPEVDNLTDRELGRMPASASEPDTADQLIEETADLPHPAGRVVTPGAAESDDGGEHRLRGGGGPDLALIRQHGAPCPSGVVGLGALRTTADRC